MNRIVAITLLAAFALVMFPRQGETALDAAETAKKSLEHYFQAWNENDEGKRRAHLEAGWAEDATYTDPSAHVEGHDALVAHIGGFLSDPQYDGFSIVRVSAIDIHHSVFRFQWEMRDAEGNTVVPGIDYGEFNEEGKITKIVGFFGPFQPIAP